MLLVVEVVRMLGIQTNVASFDAADGKEQITVVCFCWFNSMSSTHGIVSNLWHTPSSQRPSYSSRVEDYRLQVHFSLGDWYKEASKIPFKQDLVILDRM